MRYKTLMTYLRMDVSLHITSADVGESDGELVGIVEEVEGAKFV